MNETETKNQDELLYLTTDIVVAHVGNNSVSTDELGALIQKVHATLANLSGAASSQGQGGLNENRPAPAVPVKKSVQKDYIVCLEDGKKLKMLRRHLKAAYDMSPQQYRERWNLPSDYPMVAPSYAEKRSKLAKEIGLGVKTTKSSNKSTKAPVKKIAAKKTAAKKSNAGRKKKAA